MSSTKHATPMGLMGEAGPYGLLTPFPKATFPCLTTSTEPVGKARGDYPRRDLRLTISSKAPGTVGIMKSLTQLLGAKASPQQIQP